ncbi:Fic family protein [Mollicutes bacterium LVI A0039]|nr:Fic family protein [Mollicutes bacterium LVI A0039]
MKYSKKLNDLQYKIVFDELCLLYKKSNIKLKKIDKRETNTFNWVRSYRSSVTEGNTTTIDEFTKIVLNEQDDIVGQTQDNINEIINLKKVYDEYGTVEFKLTNILRVHRMLGNNILKNNLYNVSGRWKSANNYITTKNSGVICFSDKSDVVKDMKCIEKNINKLEEGTEAEIFAKYIIIHNEIVSVHPFVDGNGRTARVIAEAVFIRNGYIPYSPFSSQGKYGYQEDMEKYNFSSMDDIVQGYTDYAKQVIRKYNSTVEDITKALRNTNKKIT